MADDRRSPRIAANAFLRIQMEPNNEAIVLNFSDGGLGFRASNPLMYAGMVRFSFSDNGQRFDTAGQLVWTDPTKKIGGLSFASLPAIERERIRRWIDKAVSPKVAPAAPVSAIPPRQESAPALDPAPPPAKTESSVRFSSPITPAPQAVGPGFALFDDNFQPARGTWDEMSDPQPRSKFLRGFVSGAIVTAILAVVLFFAFADRANSLRTRLAERMGAASPAPLPVASAVPAPAPPPPAPTQLPPPAAANLPETPTPAPARDDADNSKATESLPKSAAEPRPLTSRHATQAPATVPQQIADSGDQDFALAQRYLDAKSGPGGRAAATGFLWSAVKKGNLEAEITLAEMYAHGDGVPKNCDQARVLLRAASKRGSSEASEELAEILRRGCH